MSFLNRNTFRLLPALSIVAATLISPLAPSTAHAQSEPAEPSKIDLMIQVVLSDATEISLREANAANLFRDPQAHQALVTVLESPDHVPAKTIICRMIASHEVGFSFGPGDPTVPPAFIDPLFQLLLSEDQELSLWAGRALAQCRDGVAARLEAILDDPARPQQHRLAAISALEVMPGRQAVLALGPRLADPDPQIQQRARTAVMVRLGLRTEIDWHQFQHDYLPRLAQMSEDDFLRCQLALQRRELSTARTAAQQGVATVDFWRRKCLDALALEFDRRKGPAKLTFVREQLNGRADDPFRVWALQRIDAWSRQGQMTDEQPAVAEFLAPFINDGNAQVRRVAAAALSQLGEPGRALAPKLAQQLAAEDDPTVQASLLEALGTFEYAPATPDFLRLIESEDDQVVIHAARALGRTIVTESGTPTEDQAANIARSLARIYQQSDLDRAVRRELVAVMRRFAGLKQHRQLANTHFSDLLRAALLDTEGSVRLWAVYALTELTGAEVLDILLGDLKLLDDKDTRVRFAIIEVIQQFGGKDELELLRSRLGRESEDEVTKAILLACRAILERQPMEESYRWVTSLRHAEGNDQKIHREALLILLAQITAERTAGRPVPLDLEAEAYTQKAAIAQQENQLTQALSWYANLINLNLPPARRQAVQAQVLDLALNHVDDQAFFTAAAQMIPSWIEAPGGQELLQRIDQACAPFDPCDAAQLTRQAQIIAALVAPLQQFPSPAQREQWNDRRVGLALALIDQQTRAPTTEDGRLSPETVSLLQQLDPRLSDFPADGTPEQQRLALEEYRQDLQRKSPPPAPPPSDSPAPSDAPVSAVEADAPPASPSPAAPTVATPPPRTKINDPAVQPASATP